MEKRTWKIRDDATIYEIMRLHNNLSSEFTRFHDEITNNYNYTVSGLQWDKEIKQRLESERRPALAYNLIRTVINVIYGIERDNRRKAKISPRTEGDTELSNKITQVLQYYLYHGQFEKAQRRVFLDKLIARLGVYHLKWEYNGTMDEIGKLKIEAVDPREMIFEPLSDDPQWERASFVMRKHEMSLEEIINTYALNDEELQNEIRHEAKIFFEADTEKDRWLTKKLKQLFSAVYETAISSSSSQNRLFNNAMQWWNPQNGKFDILELHEKRMERRLYVKEQTKLIDITQTYESRYKEYNGKDFDGYKFEPELINKIKEEYGLKGISDVDLVNKRFVTAVIPTFQLKVNEQAYPIESRYYVYIPEYCYDTHRDPLLAQSIIDDIKDPQTDFNKARSLILELIARYANKGWILDENAISGVEEDWMTNRIAPYRRVRAGYINMIKPEEGQTISPELMRTPGETLQLIKVITNADDEVRGNASPGVTSGRHFLAKEQRQAKSFSYLLENRDYTLKAVYELAMDFIKTYVTTQTVIRITNDIDKSMEDKEDIALNKPVFGINENGMIEEKVINDIDAYDYDIEITEEPYSASAQEERYNKLSDVFNAALSVNPQKADMILPVLVKAMGGIDADKIIQIWEQSGTPSPEQQQLQQIQAQLQMIMAKLGVEEKKTEIEGKKLDNMKKTRELQQEIEMEDAISGLFANHGNSQTQQ